MKQSNSKLIFIIAYLLSAAYCGAVCHGAGATRGDIGIEVPVEDLSGCRLRHGITELPWRRSRKAKELNGYIFSFKENRLAFNPFELEDREAESFKEFRAGIIERKTGDIFFASGDRKLFFCAFSGRIKDLGEHFLHEFDGVELAEPEKISYEEEGEQITGLLPNICLGNCYLMTTLEGNLALLRVISVAEDSGSCAIQWVEGPAGAKTLEIPKGVILRPLIKVEVREQDAGIRKPPEVPAIALDPIKYWKGMEQLQRAIENHLANRKTAIETLMKIVEGGVERGGHAVPLAVKTLGEIRAAEAADLLASIIDRHIPYGASWSARMDTLFPCVSALVRIGKPGVAACLHQIIKLTAEDKGRPFREKLLVLVIVRVEGEKVARLLLEDRKASVSENKEQVENLERAIALIDEVKSWR